MTPFLKVSGHFSEQRGLQFLNGERHPWVVPVYRLSRIDADAEVVIGDCAHVLQVVEDGLEGIVEVETPCRFIHHRMEFEWPTYPPAPVHRALSGEVPLVVPHFLALDDATSSRRIGDSKITVALAWHLSAYGLPYQVPP